MKTVIVLGGSGYIGCEVIGQLLDQGYRVINVDRDSINYDEYQKLLPAMTYNADLANVTQRDIFDLAQSIKEIIRGDIIYGSICFAAYKDLSESLQVPLEYYDNNLKIVMNSLRLASLLRSRSFIFSSSAAVYDDKDETACKENTTKINNTTPYGNSKWIGERIIEDSACALGLKCVSLRYFNPVGDTDNTKDESTSLFGNISRCIKDKTKGQIYGKDYEGSKDGTCIRDYIDIRDLASAHIFMLGYADNMQNWYDVFNVGTGTGTTVQEVMEAVKKVHNDFEYVFTDRRAGDVVGSYADTTKINNAGWKCNYSLTDTIKSLKW